MRYKLCFITNSFWSIYKWNSTEFLVDFLVLEIFDVYGSYRSLGIHFSNKLRYHYALQVLGRYSEKSGLIQRHEAVATCSISGSGHDKNLQVRHQKASFKKWKRVKNWSKPLQTSKGNMQEKQSLVLTLFWSSKV